jgi:hypothetical protein
LEDNARASELALTPQELEQIERVAPKGAADGARYPDMSHVNR